MRRTGRDDQVVVAKFAVRELYDFFLRIDRKSIAKNHAGIALTAQNPPNRRRDIARIKRRGRNLIEQWLEHVMIPPVDQCDPHRRFPEPSRGLDSSKSAADNYDVLLRHKLIVSI
jgi:hypothetical protein